MESGNHNENLENENNQENENEGQVIPKEKCVFVSGIPYNTTEEQIREKFSPCGVIKEIKMPKYQDTGRNIGYAHIYFKKNKGVHKALELNKSYIGERYITVEISKGENKEKKTRKADTMATPEGCTTIFVRNLPYDVSEEEVGNFFKPCGDINSIRFVYNSQSNHFKGFCYIQFTETEAVHKALNLNGKKIKGREIIVDFEETGPKQGYKYRTDKPSRFNKEYKDIQKKVLSKKRKRTNK